MIDLKPIIERVNALLDDGAPHSITYAALECRLAIEKICYDRLRISHDYISHAHLKRWQPAAVVNTLIAEVDPHIATTRKLFISPQPVGADTPADPAELNYVEIGTEMGFDSRKLGTLWNALSGLALHVSLPRSKGDAIPAYGDTARIEAKVREALTEIERLAASTMSIGGFGDETSFTCNCGALNKRKAALLSAGQVVICVNPDCDASFTVSFEADEIFFISRTSEFTCSCGLTTTVHIRTFDKMKLGAVSAIACPGCKELNHFTWQLMQAKPPKTSPDDVDHAIPSADLHIQ